MALRATSNMADDEDEVIPPSDSSEEENYISENSNNNIGDYDPPSFPSDIDSEEVSDDNSENVRGDHGNDGPNPYRLSQTPIVNYSGDYQDEEDYFDGWKWNCFLGEEDCQPEVGPFLGKQQLLFDYRCNQPFHFFNEIFSPTLFDEIADSTNCYATQRVNRTGKNIL